jgi:GAF domain-containing protein
VEGTTTVAFSGPLAATLDERQYEAGFGPCVDAAQSGGVVRIEDTSAEALYPDFAAVARRQGVTSVLAVGLPMPAHVLGALNCYRLHAVEPLDSAAEAAVSEFAVLAGVALANATLLASRERAADRLQRSLETRAVIEQAKGIVMQVTSCDAEEAFQLLAKRSQHSNRKLRDIAADVVERASRGGPVDLSPPADGR